MNNQTITVKGITYEIVRQATADDMAANGLHGVAAMMRNNGQHAHIWAKRPNGSKHYFIVKHTSGYVTAPVGVR